MTGMDVTERVLARADANAEAALERLFALLRIPSISTDPAFAADCARCAEHLARELAALGFSTTVADARFAKPLDRDMILRLAREHEVLVTIEEGSVGGFGSHVAQRLAETGVFDRGLKYRSMVLPDIFIDQASPRDMYDIAAMNAPQIEAKVLEVLGVAVARRA